MRLRYEAMRSHEIKHLISCQPSSLKAIRFEALVPAKVDNPKHEDTLEKVDQKQAYNALIGQLKAAEARDRIRLMRLRYEAMRSHEIKHLISCQPSSLKAIRFEALVPAKVDNPKHEDTLEKVDRERVEKMVADNKGI